MKPRPRIGFGDGVVSIRGHHFLGHRLSECATVVDLGAHNGEFSAELAREYGCRCYAVEPDPGLFQKLKDRPGVRGFNCAIADENARVTLRVEENAEASRIYPGIDFVGGVAVRGVTFETFLREQDIRRVDLLKVDIEGAELALFRSTPDNVFAEIEQITIEFHDFLDGTIASGDVEAVKRRLSTLGFRYIVFSRNNGDVLFVNTRRRHLSIAYYLYLKLVSKYLRGITRMAMRRLRGG